MLHDDVCYITGNVLGESRSVTTRGVEEPITVSNEIDMLENQFSRLHLQIIAELKASSMSVDEVLESLIKLPISLRKEYQKSISSQLMPLRKEETIEGLMLVLNPLLSFMDYGLLVYLIRKFGSTNLKKDMDAYLSDIKVFMRKTTIGQLTDCFPGKLETPPNFEVLKANIGEDVQHCTLERLNILRRRYCAEVQLSDLVFSLIALKDTG